MDYGEQLLIFSVVANTSESVITYEDVDTQESGSINYEESK